MTRWLPQVENYKYEQHQYESSNPTGDYFASLIVHLDDGSCSVIQNVDGKNLYIIESRNISVIQWIMEMWSL